MSQFLDAWKQVSEDPPAEPVDLAEKSPTLGALLETAYAVGGLWRDWPKDPKTGALLPLEKCSPGAAALHAAREYEEFGNPNLFEKFAEEHLGLHTRKIWRPQRYGGDYHDGFEFTEALMVELVRVANNPWEESADWLTDPEKCRKYLRKVAFRERKRIRREREIPRRAAEAKRRFREKHKARAAGCAEDITGLLLALEVSFVEGIHTPDHTYRPPHLSPARADASSTDPRFTAIRGVLLDIALTDKNPKHRAMAAITLVYDDQHPHHLLRDLSREFGKESLQGFKRKVRRRLESKRQEVGPRISRRARDVLVEEWKSAAAVAGLELPLPEELWLPPGREEEFSQKHD
jgi:hypothetical protein